ncbi:MAG: hypothetical protein AMXMBFR72_32100 [Betaproteobacteria bacterium]
MTEEVAKPVTAEIAPPDRLLMHPSARTSPYTDVLSPADSVLRARGGIGNLAVYRELLRDDQVASTFQQRRRRVIAAETKIDAGAGDAASQAAAEAFAAELQTLPWDDITDKMLYAVFYGWGVAEILWRLDGDMVRFGSIVVRDRARFRFGMSGALYLNAPGGLLRMPEQKFWTLATGADHHDEPYGLGLAHALYWPVFFKRSNIKFWLVFLEKFGQPTSLAKLPPGQIEDQAMRAKAIGVLKNIATDAGVVVPDNMVIELLEAARSGAADYESLKSAMDAAIAKVVLSQTMTTDNGSSRAQAQVHEGVADDVVKADADLICESFRRGPLTWWTEWNFPGATPPRIWRDVEPAADQVRRAERDARIVSMGFEPTEEYVRETHGHGWVRSRSAAPSKPDAADFADPVKVEIGASFDTEPRAAIRYFTAKGLKRTFSYADMLGAAHDEAFTVAKMMDADLLAEVQASLESALANGTPFRQWADELMPTLQKAGWWGRKAVVDPLTGKVVQAQLGSPARLETIFRTNMQAAYAAQKWQTIESQAKVAPYLMYDAVDDGRTRELHASWDETVLPVSHRWWRTHYPPNGWNCRCGVIQLTKDEIEAFGFKESPRAPDDGSRKWRNPRTGRTHVVPNGIDPGFDRNVGRDNAARLRALLDEKIEALPSPLRAVAKRSAAELPKVAARKAAPKTAAKVDTAKLREATDRASERAGAEYALAEIRNGTAPDPGGYLAAALAQLERERKLSADPLDALAAVLALADDLQVAAR